ncbi:MAG: hypothetical protein VR64_13130 [Desulfatitalea sp. BRH_c12]|nr:MAG: hypothetical protein VR64_13130 [Desulfatitalea sp. BRH_c12]
MINSLGWGAQYPLLRTIGEVIYYGTIIGAIVGFLVLVGKKLLVLGYPKKRVAWFTALCIVMSFPAGYLGSRAASMFYRPIQDWSFPLLWESMLHGTSHTFHASLILPLLFGAVFCYLLRLKFFEVFDTIYLYIPLAHALGRVACLIIGCCWGNYISINLYGLKMSFQNPVPFYAILANICVFFFLRRVYHEIYAEPRARERYAGAVLAAYFILYAPIRITFEVFRRERKIALGLTQAQFAMIFYIFFALVLMACIYIFYRRSAVKRAACSGEPAAEISMPMRALAAETTSSQTGDRTVLLNGALRPLSDPVRLKALFSLGGLVVTYLLLIFLIFYLTRQVKVWQWPFQPVLSLGEAYGRIFYYLPVMLVPVLSLFWLKAANIPIWPWFRWHPFSLLFLVALAMSVYYTLELLVFKQPLLRGISFWPPVIILSVMNAFAEEIMYRLTVMRLAVHAEYPAWVANLLQSVLYSLIHFMVAGAVLGLFSLLYGFILGLVAQRSKSITPAVICHFIIDIGCIGMPILRM